MFKIKGIRINDKQLPGTPDIVLPKYRTVIFVHGCFWHGHKECHRFVIPKTNTAFWEDKIARNQKRDHDVWRQLEALGWFVVIVWECELERKCIEATIHKVEQEILANGKAYQQHEEQRKRNRQQRTFERRMQMLRHQQLMEELGR